MESFKVFVENFEKDVEDTLKKIPEKYRDLVKGYKFKTENGGTLKSYPDSVGLVSIEGKDKILKTAAPHSYSREFVLLHELGHLIWAKLDKKLKEKWNKIVKLNKERLKQSPEENFCHAFSATYSKHPPTTHHHPEWIKFIKNLPK